MVVTSEALGAWQTGLAGYRPRCKHVSKHRKQALSRYTYLCSITCFIMVPVGTSSWLPNTHRPIKEIQHKRSYSQFCLKFRCHGNKGRSEVNLNDPLNWPSPKTIP